VNEIYSVGSVIMKEKTEKLKNFIIKYHILLIVVVVLFGAAVFLTGMVTYNETSDFCYSCHINKGPYSYFDSTRAVHKDVDLSKFSCINCHKDKAVQMIYLRDMKIIKQHAQLIGNLQSKPLVSPKDVYKTEQCLICHPDRLNVVDIEPYLLADDRLKEIGLRFDKRLHSRFEIFHDADRQLCEELLTRVSLSDDEQEELELLEKIRLGNCGQCHIQTKLVDGSKDIDKQVNFIARNPISCAGCHEEASTLTHPGKPMKSPTKEVCRKCHHGQIHGKFLIFKADCDEKKDTEHCVKCHPLYMP